MFTDVQVTSKVVTLAAPKATTTIVAFDQVSSCWPGTTTTFLCPQGTGDDDVRVLFGMLALGCAHASDVN